MRCISCKVHDYDQNSISENGLCAHCETDARNKIRGKLSYFLNTSQNFSYEEWVLLYDLKDKILAF